MTVANKINLEDYRTPGSRIFTGRDRGASIRRQSNLDNIESENDTVFIVIPDNIYSINPSFFEELFVNVVKKLGKKSFLEKFKFSSEGDYQYEKPLIEAIDRILRENTALDI